MRVCRTSAGHAAWHGLCRRIATRHAAWHGLRQRTTTGHATWNAPGLSTNGWHAFRLSIRLGISSNTIAYSYQTSSLVNKSTVTMVKILDLIANDKIGVQGKVYESDRGTLDSLTILPEGTMLTLEKIN